MSVREYTVNLEDSKTFKDCRLQCFGVGEYIKTAQINILSK